MKTNDFFAGGIADNAIFDDQSDFDLQNFNTPGPKDEDDNEEEDDKSEDAGSGTNNDDPPLDDDVVHSPVPTQPGGKPH